MKVSKADKAESLKSLRKLCPPGTEVFTILRHVSRSGMSRDISLYVMADGQPVDITWHVSKVLGQSMARRGHAVKVGGCGMDMGFHLVHSLAYAIHGVVGRPHVSPGYTLRHSWM